MKAISHPVILSSFFATHQLLSYEVDILFMTIIINPKTSRKLLNSNIILYLGTLNL